MEVEHHQNHKMIEAWKSTQFIFFYAFHVYVYMFTKINYLGTSQTNHTSIENILGQSSYPLSPQQVVGIPSFIYIDINKRIWSDLGMDVLPS